MDLASKRRFVGGWRGSDDVGPAEGAMAAYFASRKQIRLRLCAFNTALTRKGLAVLSPQSGTRPAPVPEFRNNCSPQAAKWQQDPLHS